MRLGILVAWLTCLCGSVVLADDPAAARKNDFFESQVRPLLANACWECHGPSKQEGNLRLDSRTSAVKGGDYGPAVVAGDPDASWLIQAVRYDHSDIQMPPTGKLSSEQVAALTQWVVDGAVWPNDDGPSEAIDDSPRTITDDDRAFWAYQPIQRPATPDVNDADWPLSVIDRFVLAAAEQRGMHPLEDADRASWLRRVAIDLTGLPPTTDEIREFVEDRDPLAWERVADRLLTSPTFGERFGRHWLDVTYFADTTGVGRRSPLHDAWRFRDYVIQSFNNDKPYRTFVREQIAGDLLPFSSDQQREEQLVATGFLVLGPWFYFAADKEQLRMDIVDLQIDAMGRTFLGLTLGCARCHDHKFDPVPTRDYYALAGIFRSTQSTGRRGQSQAPRVDLPTSEDEAQRHAALMATWEEKSNQYNSEKEALVKRQEELQQRLAALREQAAASAASAAVESTATGQESEATDSPCDRDAEVANLEMEIAGVEKELGEANRRLPKLDRDIGFWKEVRPLPKRAFAAADVSDPADAQINRRGNPRVLGEVVPRGFLQILEQAEQAQPLASQSGRVELADWLTSVNNPLTARVYVNRLWLHLFGAGLVPTVDNFGARGDRPTHPQLLDYLAWRLIELNWSTKSLLREIVVSRTYRLTSRNDAQLAEQDPDNQWLWRMRARRLEAEVLRDAVLMVSGRLDPRRGGFTLPITQENLHVNTPSFLEDDAKIEPHVKYRRSVYMPIMRGSLFRELDVLTLFDFSDPDQVIGARSATTVPTQALFLLNSPFMQEAAEELARQALAQTASDEQRISRHFMPILNRPARPEDVQSALEFLESFAANADASPARTEEARMEAWSRYFHSLLMSAEFLYRR